MSKPNPESPVSQLLSTADGLSCGRSIKNLVMLGLSFVLMFTSYKGLSALQSSFNSSGGLGTIGLAVINIIIVVSSLAVAPLVIGRLGPKWTMVASLTGYLVYICTNLYPHWGTIIPASVLLGLCGAPLWTSSSIYVVRLVENYTRSSGSHSDSRVRRTASVFFGIFFTLYTSCNVWGNLVSFLALNSARSLEQSANLGGGNLSCGVGFCSAASVDDRSLITNRNLTTNRSLTVRPKMTQYYLMVGCFIASGVLSILVMLLLVDRTDRDSDRRRFSLVELRANIRAMLAQMTDTRQLLLVILTFNIGLSQSFASAEFTQGFVACSSGIAAVGRVMMCYGAGQIASGLVFGQVAGLVGKAQVLIAAACVQLTLETLALFWQVAAEPAWLFYAFAFAWGCVDTVWTSQMNALYGDYFADNSSAAFSVYRICEAMGYVVGFSYNKLLCMEQKLLLMMTVASTGCVAFVISAIVNRRMRDTNHLV